MSESCLALDKMVTSINEIDDFTRSEIDLESHQPLCGSMVKKGEGSLGEIFSFAAIQCFFCIFNILHFSFTFKLGFFFFQFLELL